MCIHTHILSFNEVCCSKETLNNHCFLLRNTFSCSLAYEWLNRVKTEMAKSHLCFLDKTCIPESYEVHHDFGSNIGIWDPLQPKCNSLISTTLVSRYGGECYTICNTIVHMSMSLSLYSFFSLDKFVCQWFQTLVHVRIKQKFVKNPGSWAQRFWVIVANWKLGICIFYNWPKEIWCRWSTN